MSRPSINGKPMTPAERKRLQRQRANVTKSHETKRDYQAEACVILDSAGEPNWTNLLTVYHVMNGLPKQQSFDY